ncbi:MAG: N-acetylmuramoyl-L-alanine amidase [Candidatus Aerophobetes bacterium]|nr:N-acetylmuramoyl-L-alanine amidase [Candidatus Aerophobetes bacterium]
MARIHKITAGCLLFLFSFVCMVEALPDYGVEKVSWDSSYSDYTQISLQVSREANYGVRELIGPPRLLVNLFPAKLTFPPKEIEIKDKFVQRLRLSQESEHVVKILLDLTSPKYTYSIFSAEEPSRLIIDIKGPDEDLVAGLLRKEEAPVSLPEASPRKKGGKGEICRIILDPGHGGEDPGAIGPSGLQEKEVTLSIAKKLFRLIEEKMGLEVYLIRKDDRFISLNQRTEIANQLKGNIFLSIHANAGFDKQAKGVETFYNSRYSYGEGAARVSARENRIAEAVDVSSEVKTILWDLIQNQYRQESNDLSHFIQGGLFQSTGLEDRGVKSAKFYVLRGVAMPACLIEVGFISNPWEEKELKKDSFRTKIALGIFNGLRDYIQNYNEKLNK